LLLIYNPCNIIDTESHEDEDFTAAVLADKRIEGAKPREPGGAAFKPN